MIRCYLYFLIIDCFIVEDEARRERIVTNFATMMQRMRLRTQNQTGWSGMFGRISDRLMDVR